jgi:glycosyltransferase involved in cell wall biosynthesis
MKNILLLPVFRFGKNLNSITIRTIEIYSRINKKDFNFIINLDSKTYNEIDKYYYEKIKNMDKSFGYAGKNIIKLLNGLINTIKGARKSDYIIEESEYFYSVLYAYLVHIISRKPMMIIIHLVQPDMYKNNNLIHHIIYKHIFYKVKLLFILNNESIINEFNSIFKNGKIKLFKVTNGIDVNTFYTKKSKIYDLIFIGVIEERKNAFMLPIIVEKLKNFNNDIKLLIISHSGNLDKLKTIISEKNLEKNIDIINYVSEEEKREYLARSKIFVFPTKYEGISIVIAEAMASSLPVVLFDVPTLKIFEKGTLKAKPFDIDEMVNNIIYLLKNEDIREKIGEEGRMDAIKRFDYNNVSNVENNAIKDALNYIFK